jgi:hypothetical protein
VSALNAVRHRIWWLTDWRVAIIGEQVQYKRDGMRTVIWAGRVACMERKASKVGYATTNEYCNVQFYQ